MQGHAIGQVLAVAHRRVLRCAAHTRSLCARTAARLFRTSPSIRPCRHGNTEMMLELLQDLIMMLGSPRSACCTIKLPTPHSINNLKFIQVLTVGL